MNLLSDMISYYSKILFYGDSCLSRRPVFYRVTCDYRLAHSRDRIKLWGNKTNPFVYVSDKTAATTTHIMMCTFLFGYLLQDSICLYRQWLYLSVYMYLFMSVCRHVFMCLSIHVNMYLHVYVPIYVSMFLSAWGCSYLSMVVYTDLVFFSIYLVSFLFILTYLMCSLSFAAWRKHQKKKNTKKLELLVLPFPSGETVTNINCTHSETLVYFSYSLFRYKFGFKQRSS